jgi:hypothetical protein
MWVTIDAARALIEAMERDMRGLNPLRTDNPNGARRVVRAIGYECRARILAILLRLGGWRGNGAGKTLGRSP